MSKFLTVLLCFIVINSAAQEPTVFGYWYGTANVKTNQSASNYLVELVLQPERGYVKGIINYYFKNTYRSLPVKGNYNRTTRQLNLYDIPLTFYGASNNAEVDCNMNFQAILQVAKNDSYLKGSFISLPEYKYTCPEVAFNLSLNADISKQDSVLKVIREFKESHQVWTPSATDTLDAVKIIQRRVINYVVEEEFAKRENVIAKEIEVSSDSIKVDFYDNGEIDGDSISVFFNKQLLIANQRLSSRAIHFDLALDPTKEINELTMFADNLGSIPPNTALMIVHDGEKQIQVRITSNLEKNATVRFKKKKSP